MARIRPPVKTHGGKFYLCDWVVDNFPADYGNMTYVEPFIGGGSVFLNKLPSQQEIICDKDPNIIAIWRSIRYAMEDFFSGLTKWPYSNETFEWAKTRLSEQNHENDLDLAHLEYIVRRMSRGGLRKAFAWSERLRGGQPGDVNAYETARTNLWEIHKRVAKAEVWNLDFRDSISNWNMKNVLIYLDPPYLKSTRAKGSTELYSYEMEEADHIDMLSLCKKSKSKIVISGYESKLYCQELESWGCFYKDIANHSAQTGQKARKREILWKNF